jgi:hypothetical protein
LIELFLRICSCFPYCIVPICKGCRYLAGQVQLRGMGFDVYFINCRILCWFAGDLWSIPVELHSLPHLEDWLSPFFLTHKCVWIPCEVSARNHFFVRGKSKWETFGKNLQEGVRSYQPFSWKKRVGGWEFQGLIGDILRWASFLFFIKFWHTSVHSWLECVCVFTSVFCVHECMENGNSSTWPVTALLVKIW